MPMPGWPATDGLGRRLPTFQEVGPARTDRFVGMFYFLWLNLRAPAGNGEGPRDVSKILAADPHALEKPDSPLWGGIGAYHYWGEPLFGYYLSSDRWVLRRHAQLLSDAGVDVLIFDTTNAETYRDTYRALCEVFRQVHREEGRAPGIAFMVNTHAQATADKIYHDLYEPGDFRELWFMWEGKPLMICDPGEASPAVKEFFTLRRAHWPFALTNTPYAWHWEATYPQPYGFTDDPKHPEQVNVSVAQNLRQSDGKVTNMSQGDARGRSFHGGKKAEAADAVRHGHNFQEQWSRVSELQPPFVMVTGWNEWIAGRWGKPGGPIAFVDQYDEEHSRDIEPMRGGHGDDYYLQLVANVRRYKGVEARSAASAPRSIHLAEGAEQWASVQPVFHDHLRETEPRNFDGAGGLHYENRSGRNDFVSCQVARDAETIYFFVTTREPIQKGSNWIWLLIDADQQTKTGWEGFDFIINREDGAALLEKCGGDWNWEKVSPVEAHLEANHLQLAIPRRLLGWSKGTTVQMDFKWADNVQEPGNVMDFYVSGDTAPEGRMRFRYEAE